MNYKIGRLLGNKPKEAALLEIAGKLQNGDTVVLISDIIDSVTINAAITIDGQGHTFHVENAEAGLQLYNHCKIKNCNFVIGEKANAITTRSAGIELYLEDCTFTHQTFTNAYPAVSSLKFSFAQLRCDNVTIDYGKLYTKKLVGTSLRLGNSEAPENMIALLENKAWSATELSLEKLDAVNTNLNIFGEIQRLNALESSISTRGKRILINEFMMDMSLDINQALNLKVVTGLKIYGDTTIKQVVTPDCTPDLLKQYAENAKLFQVAPKNKNVVVNLSGDWQIVNKWRNRVLSGNVNFTNYNDVNKWNFESEDSKFTWKGSKFTYRKTFTPQPKQKTAQEKLDEMIGLEEVKKKVKAYIATSIVNKKRKELGQNIATNSLHLIFSGAAGTGKTQVARLLAQILYDNGIIKKSALKEATAKDMIGEYTGQTSPKTHELIMSAKGGVLFIDEAYELDPSSGGDGYKKEAITTLVKDMDDYRADLIVIMAGYTAEMEQLLQANSGLPSRFVNKIEFPDYSEQELIAIANLQLKQQNQKLAEDGRRELDAFISQAKKDNKVDGNGRWIRNVLQFISQTRDLRIVADGSMDADPASLNSITAADVREGITSFK
ncbi:AAA family ATPase [Loigolactobacillus zhaoyuanensis]|uniref:AAA family ATPase n=1 Tax=Loigolactobacillus zhaoyuanensis TaxID=2486017 RepID=A0ABW8UDB7_9LACO|nr:AAA family ATPase [Loigolactobacillus zhaoyuanensis]